ncbi:MAG: hypothetical protein ACWA5Q_05025 [bacterium]
MTRFSLKLQVDARHPEWMSGSLRRGLFVLVFLLVQLWLPVHALSHLKDHDDTNLDLDHCAVCVIGAELDSSAVAAQSTVEPVTTFYLPLHRQDEGRLDFTHQAFRQRAPPQLLQNL